MKAITFLANIFSEINLLSYKPENVKHEKINWNQHKLKCDLVCQKDNCKDKPKCSAEVIMRIVTPKVEGAKIVCGDKTYSYP